MALDDDRSRAARERAEKLIAEAREVVARSAPFDMAAWSARQPDPANEFAWRAWMNELPPLPEPAHEPVQVEKSFEQIGRERRERERHERAGRERVERQEYLTRDLHLPEPDA